MPPEFDGRAEDYIQAVCAWLPLLANERLVDAVDVFCERIAFTLPQTRRVFAAAKALVPSEIEVFWARVRSDLDMVAFEERDREGVDEDHRDFAEEWARGAAGE